MDTRTAIREYTEDSQLRAILEVLPDSAEGVSAKDYWDKNERDWHYITSSVQYIVQNAVCEDADGITFTSGDGGGVVECHFKFDSAEGDLVFSRGNGTGVRVSLYVGYEIKFSMFHEPASCREVVDVKSTDALGLTIENLVAKVKTVALKRAAETMVKFRE